MILEEFDNGRAVIEPSDASIEGGGEVCDTLIFCFSGAILEQIKQEEGVYQGGYIKSINGRHPWYIYKRDDLTVAVTLAPVGAAMTVGQLEHLKARGFKHFIVLGSCGVLDKSIAADRIILPETALRDEGTSYHYAPASDEISYDPALLLTLEAALDKAGIAHTRAKAWTTDAFFRETPAKVKRRLAAGASVVDMEASAIMAWAQFRDAKVYQFFYTADYVDHHQEEWDQRHQERQLGVMTFFEVALVIAREIN